MFGGVNGYSPFLSSPVIKELFPVMQPTQLDNYLILLKSPVWLGNSDMIEVRTY